MSRRQRTISLEAEIEGHGLFTGQTVHLRLRPAPPNTGLVLTRVDLGPEATVTATIQSVAKRFQRTTLVNGEACVETTEHFLAALAGLGIDNLYAEVNGPEMPAGDGSAADYVRLLRQAGIVEQEGERPVLSIAEPITVQEGDALITALPGPEAELQLTYHLDYGPGGVIPPQVFSLKLTPDAFVEELATTRTFILDTDNNRQQDAADKVFELGVPGDKPFAGDFDGKGVDTVGVYHETQPQTARAKAPASAGTIAK